MLEEKKLDKGYSLMYFYDSFGNKIRTLYSGSSHQSITYTNHLKNELFDSFTTLYTIADTYKENVESILVLGGGGFSYPKYFISRYQNATMDVVEIDDYMIEVAKEYFFLNDLYNEHDKEHKRLQIYNEDALTFLVGKNKKYDSILIDLFIDNVPIYKIFEKDYILMVKNSLNPDGIVVINYIITEKDKEEGTCINILNELKKYFDNVSTYTTPIFFKKNLGNILIVCSNKEIDMSKLNAIKVEL